MFEVPMPSMRPALRSLRRAIRRHAASSIPRLAPAVLPRAPTRAAAALALAALSLAGCDGSDDPNRFPPACPGSAILADAADITRTDGRGHDITDTVMDGRITGMQGACRDSPDRKALDATIRVGMDVGRGPAATGRTEKVAYFVSVERDGRILDKQVMTLDVAFPANTDRVHVEGEAIPLRFPLSKGVTGAAYRILIGFQLTPEQLAANRARGPR
ncbi:MAG: hypothetical protein ACRYGC_14800 [Janthinobacterium lividum]